MVLPESFSSFEYAFCFDTDSDDEREVDEDNEVVRADVLRIVLIIRLGAVP